MAPLECYRLAPERLMGGAWPLAHLDWLAGEGVSVVVNLTERAYGDDRFRIHQIGVGDGKAPGEAQIDRFCRVLQDELAAGHRVYVHCAAGRGRTGTMMACYLIYRDRCGAAEAIARVRGLAPRSVETDAQEAAVAAWTLLMQATGYRLSET